MAFFGKEQVIRALSDARRGGSVDEPVADMVRKIAACDGYITIDLAAPTDGARRGELESFVKGVVQRAAQDCGAVVKQLKIVFVEGGRTESADARGAADPHRDVAVKPGAGSKTAQQGETTAKSAALPGVQRVIAVGAGKGGVGKSTIAVNLAVGLARQGYATGILDADIYGPSLPTLLGLDGLEATMHENRLQVFYVHGVKAMTIGKLVDPEKPLIWRGPMAHGAFKQLAEQTDWGELDYLIIDLPPGTGDVPLTMAQMLTLTGAVIVCTPQKVAQDDAIRAVRMFQQLRIDVLGIVENMSVFIGDDGKEYDIFGRGGAELMAQRLGLPFLGALPLTTALREHSDAGTPGKNFSGGGPLSKALEKLTRQVEMQADLASGRSGAQGPKLTVR